jgi:hypothetical protein
MRKKILSLLLIMTSKPWSFCWLRLCNFWTLLLIAMHISCRFCCRLLFNVLIFASKASEILLMSKFLVFCGIVVFNVKAFKPITWWQVSQCFFLNSIDFVHNRLLNWNRMNFFCCKVVHKFVKVTLESRLVMIYKN